MMPTLPPLLQTWLTQFNLIVAQSEQAGIKPTPEQARLGLANITTQFVTDIPSIANITDSTISHTAIPCRVYQPMLDLPLPVILFFHGGGHMCGNIDVYDPICRKLADYCQCIVVSIDYRLAPEHPYPAGIQDATSSLKKLYATLDKLNVSYLEHITLIGDSAGAAMAATVIQETTNTPPIIEKLILIYPSLDYTLSADSLIDNGMGYILETNKIEWYFNQYLQHNEDRKLVSPLFGNITDSHPKTLIVTAGFCPLKGDAISYLQRLKLAGVPCQHLHLDNMPHAYLNLEDLAKKECEQTYTAIAYFINSNKSQD